MTLTEQIIAVAERYSAITGKALTSVSAKFAGAGHVLPGLKAGQSTMTIAKAERVLHGFDASWPPFSEWPADVPRPSVVAAEADEAEQAA